jgi:predicted  nucleic acid-binding Zn-ribbon protein
MDDKPTQDLATRAFQKRVLDELIALRAGQSDLRNDVTELRSEVTELRSEVTELRSDVTELRTQQAAMAKNIAALDQRLTNLEQRVDERLKETRPIWEAVQIQIQRLGEKLDGAFLEFQELRAEIRLHGRRIAELERRVLS